MALKDEDLVCSCGHKLTYVSCERIAGTNNWIYHYWCNYENKPVTRFDQDVK